VLFFCFINPFICCYAWLCCCCFVFFYCFLLFASLRFAFLVCLICCFVLFVLVYVCGYCYRCFRSFWLLRRLACGCVGAASLSVGVCCFFFGVLFGYFMICFILFFFRDVICMYKCCIYKCYYKSVYCVGIVSFCCFGVFYDLTVIVLWCLYSLGFSRYFGFVLPSILKPKNKILYKRLALCCLFTLPLFQQITII